MKTGFEKFKVLHALPVSTVILDRTGKIVGVNEAWKEFGRRNGLCLPDFGLGANYLDFCGSDDEASSGFDKELRQLLAGRRDLVTRVYPCSSPTQERWFFLVGLPLSLTEPAGIAILHADLTSFVPLPIVARGRGGKARESPNLMDAIAGSVETSVSDTLASHLSAMFGTGTKTPPRKAQEDGAAHVFPRARLSKRQMEVLRLLGEGKTNAEIAKAIFRSPNTVKLHVSAILRELNVKTRTQAALLASQLPKAGTGRRQE